MDAFPILLSVLRAALADRQLLALENLALRQQVGVLRRGVKRPRLEDQDRIFWIWLMRMLDTWRDTLLIADRRFKAPPNQPAQALRTSDQTSQRRVPAAEGPERPAHSKARPPRGGPRAGCTRSASVDKPSADKIAITAPGWEICAMSSRRPPQSPQRSTSTASTRRSSSAHS